jgi:hypothetical protein
MTSANATGYYETGETEDYRVIVDNYPLTVNLLSFDVQLDADETVSLDWQTSGEENFMGYEIERSSDNSNWSVLSFIYATGNGNSTNNRYAVKDTHPLIGKSYYRLKMLSINNKYRYSDTKTITIEKKNAVINIYPNPAASVIKINILTATNNSAEIILFDNQGKAVYKQTAEVRRGSNTFELPGINRFNKGIYFVHIIINNERHIEKLILK